MDNPTVNPVTPIDIGFDPLVKPVIKPTEYLPIGCEEDPVKDKLLTAVSDFTKEVIIPVPEEGPSPTAATT